MTDPGTRAAYAGGADVYQRNRPPVHGDRAAALLTEAVPGSRTGRLVALDAGCGTGAYLPDLRARSDQVVALDLVAEMLRCAEGPGRVQASLTALPLRRNAVDAAWARNTYLHLGAGHIELALAELHRAMPVGAPVCASFIAEPTERFDRSVARDAHSHFVSDDDLPGRIFHTRTDEALRHLFAGAGFESVRVERSGGRARTQWVTARRAWTLPDWVGADMGMLVCGLNPSPRAADAGVGYANPSNRFWTAALAAGVVSVERDPRHALVHHGLGMTDIVKRTTRRAAELSPAEYRDGLSRVEALCRRLAPAAVVMVGLSGWRAAADPSAGPGWQPRRLGPSPVYLMPSTSGLNAHVQVPDLAAHLRTASGPVPSSAP